VLSTLPRHAPTAATLTKLFSWDSLILEKLGGFFLDQFIHHGVGIDWFTALGPFPRQITHIIQKIARPAFAILDMGFPKTKHFFADCLQIAGSPILAAGANPVDEGKFDGAHG